jgi:hypothetical protein
MGLSLPAWMSLEASGAVDPSQQKIRNCITIFLVGSPGQLDTWDMKPEAPAEIRGKFKPIDTNVPGIQICEHFPLMARMMDKVALIRSLHHKTGATHENGQRWMMTGHDFNPDSMKPYLGSVISRVFGNRGMLNDMVVCVLSEFGRTPSINPRGGRDHHPGVWTNFMAGGPIKGGQVIGSSDM